MNTFNPHWKFQWNLQPGPESLHCKFSKNFQPQPASLIKSLHQTFNPALQVWLKICNTPTSNFQCDNEFKTCFHFWRKWSKTRHGVHLNWIRKNKWRKVHPRVSQRLPNVPEIANCNFSAKHWNKKKNHQVFRANASTKTQMLHVWYIYLHIDGKWQTIYTIHTDPMGNIRFWPKV